MTWFIRSSERFMSEVEGIENLRGRQAWLGATATRIGKGLKFAVDFDLIINGETLPFTLEYPAFFPETPPSVLPLDGRHHSDHQYGVGGELCLEFRSDNWDPSVTGAMMIESTYRLLSGERPALDERAVVPSEHRETLGQGLRGSVCRYLLTRSFASHVATLQAGTRHQCSVVDITGPNRTWVAYVASIGPASSPSWREDSIPVRGGEGEPALLVRVASLPATRASHQESLDQLTSETAADDASTASAPEGIRITVVTDAEHAHLYFSFQSDGVRRLLPYRTIDLVGEVARLPEAYAQLASKKVGIVGSGSLGSKIAASLARSGVGSFVLVDDDLLLPANLARHELDVGALGAHKVDGLQARLHAVAPHVQISARRVVLGGQESSGITASVLDELATCDLLIDATADPQAFNLVAAVARNALRPMIWTEVYAGGIGGFVARLRPGIEPHPHAARRQYLAWCRNQGIPWGGEGDQYGANRENVPPLVADDADVAVIAAHASRIAVDALIRPGASAFPHSAYVVGLSTEWIFTAPFDTHPIDFVPEDAWRSEVTAAQTTVSLEHIVTLLEKSVDAG